MGLVYKCKVVIRFGVVVPLSGRKQEVSDKHLVYHAGKRPDIRSLVVLDSQNNLWRPILSGLYLGLEVVVGPAGISKVSDLEMELSYIRVLILTKVIKK